MLPPFQVSSCFADEGPSTVAQMKALARVSRVVKWRYENGRRSRLRSKRCVVRTCACRGHKPSATLYVHNFYEESTHTPTSLLQPTSATMSTRRASRNGSRDSRLRCSARSPEWMPCQRKPRKCSGSTSRRNLSTFQLSSPRVPSRIHLQTRRERLDRCGGVLGSTRFLFRGKE